VFLTKFVRIERGLSQVDLAKLMGTRQPTISAIESGRTNPTDRERKALSRVLGVAPERLLIRVDTTLVWHETAYAATVARL
jgi:transcriptional regulator with XRE-family HTH domain